MLKVTPKGGGKPYYLVDTTGQGNWTRRDSLDNGVRVPMWPLLIFD
jgi:6-phosphogluconate dehydrogenase (decarboxylating)